MQHAKSIEIRKNNCSLADITGDFIASLPVDVQQTVTCIVGQFEMAQVSGDTSKSMAYAKGICAIVGSYWETYDEQDN